MLHQESFQTLVERYERVNVRVRDLVADAKVDKAKMAAMKIRMDFFEEKLDAELARLAAAPTNGVVETQYNIQM